MIIMEVSVVIPTYDRAEDLKEALDSILRQTVLPKEVIVVDDSEDYEVMELAGCMRGDFERRNVELAYIHSKEERSNSIAKNTGVKRSSGEIVLFLDSDVVLDENYVMEILRVFEEKPEALGVEGYQVNVGLSWLDNLYNRLFFLRYFEEARRRILPSTAATYPLKPRDIMNVDVMSGSNMSFKRSVFSEFGFDEYLKRYSYREDFHLCCEVREKYPNSLYLTPRAKVVHKLSGIGKPLDEEMIRINVIYTLYFFYQHIPQTFWNRLIFLWSRLGVVIAFLLHAREPPKGPYQTCIKI